MAVTTVGGSASTEPNRILQHPSRQNMMTLSFAALLRMCSSLRCSHVGRMCSRGSCVARHCVQFGSWRAFFVLGRQNLKQLPGYVGRHFLEKPRPVVGRHPIRTLFLICG
jgi:hypothetical protein